MRFVFYAIAQGTLLPEDDASHAKQVWTQFYIFALLRPQIEGDRREFVD